MCGVALTGLTTSMMFCLFIMLISDSWFRFWSARQRVDFKYKYLIVITLVVAIAKPLLGCIAIFCVNNNQALARIISLAIVEFVAYIGLFISQIRKSHIFFDKRYWIIALKFNIVLIPHYLSQRILNHSDRIMINNYVGDSAAGIYSLAYNIASLMVLFNTGLLNTITPWNYQQLKKKNYSQMETMANITVIIIALINICLILVAPEILIIFAPKSYYEALYVIPPVSIGCFFMFMYGIFVNVEMYYSKNIYIMISSVTGAMFNLILNYLFIPRLGYIAAAYTTLFSYIIYCAMHALFVVKIRKQNNILERIFDFKHLLILSIAFIFISFIIMLTYKHIIIRYGFVVLISILLILNRNRVVYIMKKIFTLKKMSRE